MRPIEMDPGKMYYRKWTGYNNLIKFVGVIREFPELDMRQPAPMAPWHWQTEINGIKLNFWPHRLRVQQGADKSKTGINAIRNAILLAKAALDVNDETNLIE